MATFKSSKKKKHPGRAIKTIYEEDQKYDKRIPLNQEVLDSGLI